MKSFTTCSSFMASSMANIFPPEYLYYMMSQTWQDIMVSTLSWSQWQNVYIYHCRCFSRWLLTWCVKGLGSNSWPAHTKGFKMVLGTSLVSAQHVKRLDQGNMVGLPIVDFKMWPVGVPCQVPAMWHSSVAGLHLLQVAPHKIHWSSLVCFWS